MGFVSSSLQFVPFNYLDFYSSEVCHCTKQPRLSFPLSINRASQHLNIGHILFLTIVDDYRRATWVYFMPHKFKVYTNFVTFCAMFQNQIFYRIQPIRSDNGSKFTCFNMQSCVQDNGILL